MRPIQALSALLASASAVAALVRHDRVGRAEGRSEDAEDALRTAEARAEKAERERDQWIDLTKEWKEEAYRLSREFRAARATADACYEIGWRAIMARSSEHRAITRQQAVELDAALADAAQARAAEQAANEREAARERGHAMHVAAVEGKLGHAESCVQARDWTIANMQRKLADAEQARAEAAADLETLRTQWTTPLGMRWELVAAEPPTAVVTAELEGPPCEFCGQVWGLSFKAVRDDDTPDRIHVCWKCFETSDGCDDIRARHAAREQAKVTAPATVVHPYDEDHGMHIEPTSPDSEDEEPDAPTQDQLDDAAVTALLSRGPATWAQISWHFHSTVAGTDDRAIAAVRRVGATADWMGVYSLPAAATEAAQ